MEHSHDRAECYLQHIVNTVRGASVSTAETHRASAESNLRNSLIYGDYADDLVVRIRRLIRTLEGASNETPARKLQILLDTVVPTLTVLGLAEEV